MLSKLRCVLSNARDPRITSLPDTKRYGTREWEDLSTCVQTRNCRAHVLGSLKVLLSVNPIGLRINSLPKRRDDEDGSSLVTAKRRSHALLLFVNYALRQTKPPTDSRTSDILPLLLQISAVATAHSDEKQVTEIDGTARTCLNSVLSIIPAGEFVSCVTTLLTGVGDKRVSVGR